MTKTADLPAAVLSQVQVGDCIEIQWRAPEHMPGKKVRQATGWVVWMGRDDNEWRVNWQQEQVDKGYSSQPVPEYEEWDAIEVDSIGQIKHARIDLRRVTRIEVFPPKHPRYQQLVEQDQKWVDTYVYSMGEWRKRRQSGTERKMIDAGVPMPKLRNRKEDCPHRHLIGLAVLDDDNYPYCAACQQVVPERRGEHA